MSSRLAFRSLLVGLLACAAFLTSCTRDPNVRKQKYFDSGQRYYAEGKYHEAAIQYANATQIDPRFAQAHYELGRTYLKLGDNAHAFQELSRTVELNPNNYTAHVDLANLLVTFRNPDGSPNTDDFSQAKSHLDILRDKQPNAPETHEAWANYYGGMNNLAPAIQEAQQAISLDPGRSESYMVLALLQLRAGSPDLAEQNFKKAVATDPKSLNAQLALGGFYQSRNRLPEAEQQFRHAIDIDPKNPGPRVALVRLLMQEGKTSEVEPFLRQTKQDLADNSEGYRMLGDFYFASGNLDKAETEYASLYSDHPKDPLVRKNYIQILILKNKIDEAAKINNAILKASPRDTDALIYKGEIQMHQNDVGGAIDSLQNALKNDPDNALAHYHLGLAYDQQHNEGQAESEWREAVRLRPDLIDAQRALAAVAVRHGDIDALMQTAQQIIAAQPYSPDGYLFRGVAEISRGRYPEAQQDAQEALQRAPQSPAPYIQMGNVHLAQKRFAEAENYYQQALDKDPSSADALSGLMNSYFADKQPEKAIAAANAQIAKSPNNSNFYDLLGTALFNGRKDLPGAEAALHKAMDLDKNNTDALEKLGKVQVQEGSVDQAIALYQQSIKNNPREVRFYILCGELYEAKQQWDQAKSMYQQALSIAPDQPLASNNLAYVLLEQGGNVDLALSMAQTARRGMPESPNAADTLGWAYYQKGVYQSAISQFQESIRLTEQRGMADDAVVHYHLGLAYQKANQNGLARQQLEKAVKLSPNNLEAKKALSELRG